MDYTIVEMPEIRLVGPSIHVDGSTVGDNAEIESLWGRFMSLSQESIPGSQLRPYPCYGLYYNYSATGHEYDLLVGCRTGGSAPVPEGMATRVVPVGRYAKFEIRGGHMVRDTVAAWERIFADEGLMAQRSFTGDYEAYYPGEDVENADIDIYVALRGGVQKRAAEGTEADCDTLAEEIMPVPLPFVLW